MNLGSFAWCLGVVAFLCLRDDRDRIALILFGMAAVCAIVARLTATPKSREAEEEEE